MMKTTLAVTALVAGTLALGATVASAQRMPSPHDDDPGVINISCYRGFMETVAWDRPNSVFINDLMQLGYNRTEATVIGEHICRDEYGVRNPEHQRAQLLDILASDPPG